MFHPFDVFAVSSIISKISFTYITIERAQARGRAVTKIIIRIISEELKSCGFSATKDNTILKLLTSIYMVRERVQNFGEWHTQRVVKTAKFPLVYLPQFLYKHVFLTIVVLQKLNECLGNNFLLLKTSARPRAATTIHSGMGMIKPFFKQKRFTVAIPTCIWCKLKWNKKHDMHVTQGERPSENSHVSAKARSMIYKRNYVKRKGETSSVAWAAFNSKIFSRCPSIPSICSPKLTNYSGKSGRKYDDWCNTKDNFVDPYD